MIRSASSLRQRIADSRKAVDQLVTELFAASIQFGNIDMLNVAQRFQTEVDGAYDYLKQFE